MARWRLLGDCVRESDVTEIYVNDAAVASAYLLHESFGSDVDPDL